MGGEKDMTLGFAGLAKMWSLEIQSPTSLSASLRMEVLETGWKYTNDPMTNSWEVISKMPLNRHLCQAAAMDDNQLIVVGGVNDAGTIADSMYIASVSVRRFYESLFLE